MAIDTIKSVGILDGSIATADIADDAVTSAKLGSITDIASSSGAMTLSPAGTEIVNVGTTGDILVKGTSNQRAALLLRAGSNTANSQIQLGDQASDTSGRILYDHSDDTMRFNTNGSERFRVSASGIHIGGTGAANAFDDYEEGTFTATLAGSTTNPSTPVTLSSARYTKVGRLVFVQGQFTNVNTTGAAGGVRVTGLPFAASTSFATGNVMTYVRFTIGGTARNVSPYVTGTQISFYQSVSGGGWGEIAHSAGTGAYLAWTALYDTNA